MRMVEGLLIFIGVLVVIGWFAGRPAKDDTDPPDGRSGLRLYVDHRTGLHYIGGLTGITPRLDRDGNHIGDPR